MPSDRVYLDWNATAPLRPEAREAMIAAMDAIGNPSSVHAEGRAAKSILEKAREQVATLMGCDTGDIVFTSSATEAAAMAFGELSGSIGSGIEHDAVWAHLSYNDVAPNFTLDVDQNGVLTGTISGPDVSHGSVFNTMWDDLVALQAANSETGVLQGTLPIAQEIWATQRGAHILVDAVQAIGKTPWSVDKSGADFAMASAHKIGGPKGVGALFVKSGVEPRKVLKGGGQEKGRRSGTENIIGIAGFGGAADGAARDIANGVWAEVEILRNQMEDAIAAASPETTFIGKTAPRLPNTSCMMTPGWKGETQVMQMDLAGFAISAGSACSSGKVRESRVLRAMGFDDVESRSAIRVSIGPTTTRDDVMGFVDAWVTAHERFKKRAA
ncbi:MAG: cysteine desulfurase family protein [Pseudomonadota bacterium]